MSKKRISYDTIVAALNEDPDAIAIIRNHYKNLIKAQSRRTYYGPKGEAYHTFDEDLQNQVASMLIHQILTEFRLETPEDDAT